MPPSTVSLLITTYNWPSALARTLDSIRRQSRLPDEVVIADDGSGPETRALLQYHAGDFPVPLRHVWQHDLGFRAARARNLAISAATGSYIVLLDGDMVLHPRFIADHLDAAKVGYFVQGSRVLMSSRFSERMLSDPEVRPGFFSGGIERRRHTLRLPLLSKLYMRLRGSRPAMIKTCNQGWWRDDLIRLNGFDERMLGWGREDEELSLRAMHAGIGCRQLRLRALAFHLYHCERHQDGESANDIYLAQSRTQHLVRCETGIDGHRADFDAHPAPDLRGGHAMTATSY